LNNQEFQHMSIQVGDKIPAVTIKRLGATGLEEVDTGSLFAGKKVVFFGVPGAFTPTCHKKHLPGYVANADAIKAKGVDEIVCMAVNDPFTLNSWGDALGATGKVSLLPDWNADLTKAMGLEFDGSGAGLGTRCKRFSMLVEDGEVKSLEVEAAPSDLTKTSAESCMLEL
jgi:peroxiredoxin